MSFERLNKKSVEYQPCRYPGSKLLFRGPKRSLEGDYVACLGGTNTYGKFIDEPYPSLIELQTGMKCINFGWPNVGPDAFLNDTGIQNAARNAVLTVLQVPGVLNMSNRFYTVHPRRNDRFLAPSNLLRKIYGEVDFTEFHFTRHMLKRLESISAERFSMVCKGIQECWVERMQSLLSKLEGDVVLFWFSTREPNTNETSIDVAMDPNLVSRRMLEVLRPQAADIVEVKVSASALSEGTRGMVFSELESLAAKELLGPTAHFEAAAALVPCLLTQIG